MANPYLLLSGIGMIALGIALVIWWKLHKNVKMRFFLYGGFVWAAAIIPKLIMDMTVSSYVSNSLIGFGIIPLLIGVGIYVGIRTGLFESGFSYFAILKTKLRKMKLKDAIAFGLGFGATEAIFLGFISLVNMAAIIANPDLIVYLPPQQIAMINLPTIVVIPSILERLFSISIHIFGTLLVVYSVAKKKLNYLAYSVLFKALADGMVPFIGYYFDLASVTGIFYAEIPVAIMGFAAYFGIRWMIEKF